MPTIFKKYGEIVEITKIEKEPKPRKYAYTIPEKGVLYSELGDPIIFEGQDKYVCGGCLLLLKTYGCPLLVTLTFAGDASDASYANDSFAAFQVRLRNKFPPSAIHLYSRTFPKRTNSFSWACF